jgi:hypothetical protein
VIAHHDFGRIQLRRSSVGTVLAKGGPRLPGGIDAHPAATTFYLPPAKPQALPAERRTEVKTVPPIVHEVLASSGQPLDRPTCALMESHFGHDFSRVRVHLDYRAAASAAAVGASAYMVGHDIVFAKGHFAPQTAVGKRLLAHELAHTVQQSGVDHAALGELSVGDVNDPLEHEAESASTALFSARAATPWAMQADDSFRSDARPVLRRQPIPHEKTPEPPTFESTLPPKKEEGGADAPAPVGPACKYPSAEPVPCHPKGVSNNDFLKSGAPIDAFGFTRAPHQEIPNPEIKTKPMGKQVVLLPTKATQVSCESYFVKAGKEFQRVVPIDPKDPKQAGLAEQCGSSYRRDFKVTPDGEKKLIEAEMEHCNDFKYAFDMSVGCYVAIVNDLAKKGTRFPSHEEAVEAVTQRVGRKPDTWVARYLELIEKSVVRDTRKWHTAAIPEGPGLELKVVGRHCESATTTEIDDKSFPQVGKHPASEIIK